MSLRHKTLFIDFDGTICKNTFPGVGEPLEGAIQTLLDLKAAGYRLVLWTCREDEGPTKQYLSNAVNFCKSHGVEFDGVNETLDRDEFRDSELRRKPHYYRLIDDKNLGGFPGWDWVRSQLLG